MECNGEINRFTLTYKSEHRLRMPTDVELGLDTKLHFHFMLNTNFLTKNDLFVPKEKAFELLKVLCALHFQVVAQFLYFPRNFTARSF